MGTGGHATTGDGEGTGNTGTGDDTRPDDTGTSGGDESSTPCWPFDRPSIETLRASPKKVFAHYFSPYPISLDNADPDDDYYARHYLRPDGENGAYQGVGGLLRERPLPRAPWGDDHDYVYENLATEVRRAIHVGLDGFAFDVLNPNPDSPHRIRLDRLLEASQGVDPEFRILLVPDMTATSFGGSGTDQEQAALDGLRQILGDVGDHPAVLRLEDGRVVVAPFGSHRRTAAFWTAALETLAVEGFEIAFMPMPTGYFDPDDYVGVPLWGAACWGSRRATAASTLEQLVDTVHDLGLVWMHPVAPQDQRPKSGRYIETEGSEAYRALWRSAIDGDADWVQIITWNDYSEHSEISPSTRTQTAFYDLTSFYVSWFKLGEAPPIERDALYYFHRAHHMDVNVAPPALQPEPFTPLEGPSATDEVELLGLLTAPGTLEIEIDGEIATRDVEAGIVSLVTPITEGTPIFRLRRGGEVMIELISASAIDDTIDYQDPLYHAGAEPTCDVPW